MRDQDQQHRRFELYTRAVQSPEREVELLARRFQRLRGRAALSLREDFAGTGATSQAWVESHDERTAEAVDHDEAALTHGRRRADHLDAAESSRLRFVAADMTRRSERAFDVIAAMNFSWAVLDDDLLDRYLRAAADCLEDDGVLALEYFGGPELSRPHQT